jgi:hypothetical protein
MIKKRQLEVFSKISPIVSIFDTKTVTIDLKFFQVRFLIYSVRHMNDFIAIWEFSQSLDNIVS